jgi:hypothetical protein
MIMKSKRDMVDYNLKTNKIICLILNIFPHVPFSKDNLIRELAVSFPPSKFFILERIEFEIYH